MLAQPKYNRKTRAWKTSHHCTPRSTDTSKNVACLVIHPPDISSDTSQHMYHLDTHEKHTSSFGQDMHHSEIKTCIDIDITRVSLLTRRMIPFVVPIGKILYIHLLK